MTSVIFSRPSRSRRTVSRRRVRVASAAVGLVGALLLTACSGDGGSGDDSASGTGPSATATTDTGAATDAPGASTSPSGTLEGSWLTTAKGRAVALMINGRQAGLFATGGTVCSGTADQEAGMEMIYLKCANGNKDRTTGMVDSVNKTTLKVTWEGALGQETFTRAEGGKLPTALPTASVGS